MGRVSRLGPQAPDLKLKMDGLWPVLFEQMGLPAECLSGRSGPCPRCGGTDRFRLLDEDVGALRCNKCFPVKCGDGLAAVMWWLDRTFQEACNYVAEWLDGHGEVAITRHPPARECASPLGGMEWLEDDSRRDAAIRSWCEAKPPISAKSVARYGANLCLWPAGSSNQRECLALPVRSPDGHLTGVMLYGADGEAFFDGLKTRLIKGSKEGWLWAGTGNDLGAAKVLVKAEGVPDALALASAVPPDWAVITNAAGAQSVRQLDFSFALGKCVIVVGDCDRPGQRGAELFSDAFLRAGAKRVKNVLLPYEVQDNHGRDLRDWLAEGNGFAELRALAHSTSDWAKQINDTPRRRDVRGGRPAKACKQPASCS